MPNDKYKYKGPLTEAQYDEKIANLQKVAHDVGYTGTLPTLYVTDHKRADVKSFTMETNRGPGHEYIEISKTALDQLTPKELNAWMARAMYHAQDHQKDHKLSAEDKKKSEETRADEYAARKGYSEDLISGMEKMRNYNQNLPQQGTKKQEPLLNERIEHIREVAGNTNATSLALPGHAHEALAEFKSIVQETTQAQKDVAGNYLPAKEVDPTSPGKRTV